MTDRMPDERLAQLDFAVHSLSPFPFDHPATRIVQDAIAELVAEAKRARSEEDRLHEENDLLRVDVTNVFPDREALADDAIAAHEENEQLRDLLGSISLYVNWRFTTKQLTTEQKELWARVVDAWSMGLQGADGYAPERVTDRWWRDDVEVSPPGL